MLRAAQVIGLSQIQDMPLFNSSNWFISGSPYRWYNSPMFSYFHYFYILIPSHLMILKACSYHFIRYCILFYLFFLPQLYHLELIDFLYLLYFSYLALFIITHIQTVPDLKWLNLWFFYFMTVQKQYAFSRNYTSNFEFCSFPWLAGYSLVMRDSDSKPHLPVGHVIMRVNNQHSQNHSALIFIMVFEIQHFIIK